VKKSRLNSMHAFERTKRHCATTSRHATMSSDAEPAIANAAELAAALLPLVARMTETLFDAQRALARCAGVPAGQQIGSLKRVAGATIAGEKPMTKKQKRELKPHRAPTAFNLFMKSEVAKVKAEQPGLAPKEVFTACAARWKAAKEKEGSLHSTPPPSKKEKHKDKSHKKDKKDKSSKTM
jgi:hypothetical protein